MTPDTSPENQADILVWQGVTIQVRYEPDWSPV